MTDQTALSDAFLLFQARDGDEQAFEVIYGRHYGRVYGILFRLAGTREDAEDLAQEIFMKLHAVNLGKISNLSAWLYRVAVNSGYNHLRTRQRQVKWQGFWHRSDTPAVADPQAATEIALEREQVRRTLAKLPKRQAQLLLLRQMDFKYSELAEIVGVAPASVGTLLSRASKAFSEAYDHGGEK